MHAQVVTQLLQTDAPADFVVNNIYIRDDTVGPLLPVDWQNTANQVRDAFYKKPAVTHGLPFTLYNGSGGTVKLYDAQVKGTRSQPIPPQATASYVPTTWLASNTLGPRQVALCLSYYAQNNYPRRRGRIYICAAPLQANSTERPTASRMNELIGLADSLHNIGGANQHHVVWSHADNAANTITNYWVNNTWDTQRSRVNWQETSRVTQSY